MSTTKKLKGWVKNDAAEWMEQKGNVGLLFANATNGHLSFPATLVLHGSGEHKEVYTAEEVMKIAREAYYINPGETEFYFSDFAAKHNIPL